MLLDIRMPAFISSAILPRHNTPRRVLAFLPTIVELPEATESSLALVARGTYCRHDSVVDIRHRAGLFYRKLRLYTGGSLEKSLINHFWHETFVKQAKLALPQLGDVLPKGAAWNIIKRNTTAKTIPHLQRIARTMKLTEEGEEELEEARKDLAATVSSAVMLDGDCWVPSQEPMLSVAHWTGRPMTMDTDSHFSGARMRVLFNECSLGRTLYTMKQLPEALKADMKSPGDEGGVSMEVFDPSVFSDEVPIGEAVAMLWYIAVRRNSAKSVRRRIVRFVQNEDGWSFDSVASEIDYLLSHVALEDQDRRMLEFHKARMDDRPITVEPYLRPMAAVL
jgi:hypothetical protein